MWNQHQNVLIGSTELSGACQILIEVNVGRSNKLLK